MKTKNILSTVLALLMVITALPLTALQSSAYSNYETESNDTYASADILPLNSSISGCINKSSDKDVYKITTSQNGKLTLTFKHKYKNISDYYIPNWEIYTYQYVNGEYIKLDFDIIDVDDKESYTLTTIGAVAGGVYYVEIVDGPSDYEYGIIASNQLPKPTPKVANKNGYVSITWSKSAGAKGYYVYRKGPNDKSWVRIANVTGTSYSDKNVKSGTNYTYTVKAYNGSTYSSFHSGTAIKYLAQPAFKVANKSKNVTVSWGKVAGAKGYYVYRKAGNATSWTRIANVTGTSYVDNNVKKNVKYTYTVKAYNGKFNSAFHKGVTVKH